MPDARIVHEFSYHVPCRHYTVTRTREPVNRPPHHASVAHILAPCPACQPQTVERLRKRKEPYDQLPE